MENPYTDLLLYHGACSSNGIGEGRFDTHEYRKRNIEMYLRARKTVEEAIMMTVAIPNREFIEYEYSFSLVLSEEKAREFVRWAKTSISSSVEEYLDIICSSHGKIDFDRKIRLPDFEESQRKSLVEMIQSSGLIEEDADFPRYSEIYLKFY